MEQFDGNFDRPEETGNSYDLIKDLENLIKALKIKIKNEFSFERINKLENIEKRLEQILYKLSIGFELSELLDELKIILNTLKNFEILSSSKTSTVELQELDTVKTEISESSLASTPISEEDDSVKTEIWEPDPVKTEISESSLASTPISEDDSLLDKVDGLLRKL